MQKIGEILGRNKDATFWIAPNAPLSETQSVVEELGLFQPLCNALFDIQGCVGPRALYIYPRRPKNLKNVHETEK